MLPSREVTIIGAGIIGVACALHLRRAGLDVVLIDSGEPGNGCSFGNGGAICPGSVVPMAMPGMLSRVPGWLLDPLGPLVVRWRYFPRALPWLLRWIRAGRMDRVETFAAALNALHGSSIDGYRDLLGDADMADLIRVHGQLLLWETEGTTASERIAQSLRDTHGIRSEVVDADMLRDMEPALAPVFKRGLLLPDNAHTVDPQGLVQRLVDRFVDSGGELLKGHVRGFEFGPQGVHRLLIDGDDREVDLLAVAAGAWSRDLAARLGSRVPMIAERGYHVRLPGFDVRLHSKIVNRTRMFGLTSLEMGLQIQGTVEIAGMNAPPDYRRAKGLLEQARNMIPGLKDEDASMWMGCRPSFPDSLPVIDRSPRHRNVFFAFGHGHFGLTGAPMTGRLITDLVLDRKPSIDPGPFRLDRF